ncbi:hypothetical protein RRG08_015916 [Elysia crispata]|uniref:Uncharacterized protein n=1 Tax=Elysia crispata TaxID=231223 RepID=A0AAE1AMC5_9GAST|nr:hypothetical protein RRG08_015916 [Elysia crispata]
MPGHTRDCGAWGGRGRGKASRNENSLDRSGEGSFHAMPILISMSCCLILINRQCLDRVNQTRQLAALPRDSRRSKCYRICPRLPSASVDSLNKDSNVNTFHYAIGDEIGHTNSYVSLCLDIRDNAVTYIIFDRSRLIERLAEWSDLN